MENWPNTAGQQNVLCSQLHNNNIYWVTDCKINTQVKKLMVSHSVKNTIIQSFQMRF